ncbi:MAG: excisionase [Bacteroidota bacterium]|nr:excisionase [Bacteroidota bacterium]
MDNELHEIIKRAIKEALPQPQRSTLTIDECAEFSGIGRNKLLELVHMPNTDYQCFKAGAKFLINRQRLMIWLEKIAKEKELFS